MLLDSAPQNYANNGEKLTPVFTDLKICELSVSSHLPEAWHVPPDGLHAANGANGSTLLKPGPSSRRCPCDVVMNPPNLSVHLSQFKSQLLEELLASKDVAVNGKYQSILIFWMLI